MIGFATLKARAFALTLLLSGSVSPALASEDARFSMFFVPEGAVDYVATFREIRTERKGEPRTVFQRAGSTRVEVERPTGKTITFEGRTQPNYVHLGLDANGRYRGLHIKPKDQWSFSAALAVRSDRMQSFLNETCTIWGIPHAGASSSMLRESCITDDGIELWHKLISHRGLIISYVEATSVERRPIGDMEFLPPADLLDLKSWGVADDLPSGGKRPADFETTLNSTAIATEPPPIFAKTMRRNFPWSLTETIGAQFRQLKFEHGPANLRLEIGGRTGAFLYLHLLRHGPSEDGEPWGEKLNRSDTVLGETCDWYDPQPRMMDASLHQCRATDGIVLKEISGSRGSGLSTIEAVEVRRAPAMIRTAVPPEEVLRPGYWHIAQ
jgi:hypothetical protein